MIDREPAIRAAITAQAHLRTEFELPTDPVADIARAERAIKAYERRPVVVTDEMVERARGAYMQKRHLRKDDSRYFTYEQDMRAALEAALNPETPS